jgi:hypothetical protein
MADDRRRFMEEAIRACDEKRRDQLLERLEEIEDTGPQDKVPVLVKGDGTAVFFAKLAFQDETGAWRYGLFDPTGCEVPREGAPPTAEPILVSKRSWRRLHYDPRGIDPDKRRRTGH